MKILALDSSALVASVAIATEEKILAEYTLNFKKTHSQTLLPMLDEIVKMTDISMDEIDAVAVSSGPGSFTGLRIGAATAKGLGLALGKPIIPIPTLEGIAYNFYGSEKLICPIMDARRNQVYTGIYGFQEKESPEDKEKEKGYDMVCHLSQEAVGIDELIGKINELGKEVIFLGDGVPVQKEYIRENCEVPYSFAPAHRAYQSAASFAVLGFLRYAEGKTESAAEHKPVYLRVSQAERERAARLRERKAMLADPLSKQDETLVMYRLMEEKDVEEVAHLEEESFSEPWTKEQIKEAFHKKEYLYAVAEKEGSVVGFCTILQVAGEGQITNVAVAKPYRNCHIANALLKRAIACSRKNGNKEFTLEVRKGNIPAISLYKALGFSEAGIRKNFYRKPDEDALLMNLQAAAKDESGK